MPGGDPGDLEAAGAVLELGGEGCVVVVLDGLVGVADRGVVVAHDGAQRQRAACSMAVLNRPPLIEVMSPQRNSAT